MYFPLIFFIVIPIKYSLQVSNLQTFFYLKPLLNIEISLIIDHFLLGFQSQIDRGDGKLSWVC